MSGRYLAQVISLNISVLFPGKRFSLVDTGSVFFSAAVVFNLVFLDYINCHRSQEGLRERGLSLELSSDDVERIYF